MSVCVCRSIELLGVRSCRCKLNPTKCFLKQAVAACTTVSYYDTSCEDSRHNRDYIREE